MVAWIYRHFPAVEDAVGARLGTRRESWCLCPFGDRGGSDPRGLQHGPDTIRAPAGRNRVAGQQLPLRLRHDRQLARRCSSPIWGASEVIEVDVHANRVVRTIPALAQVHGVLAVALLNRVFATATGDNQIVAIDETSGQVVGRAPTGDYPDGIAYDSRRNAIWTTNETAGTETVVDAGDLHPLRTVDAGSGSAMSATTPSPI